MTTQLLSPRRAPRKWTRFLLPILLAAILTIALAYAFYYRIPPVVDARGYDIIALNLARGIGYRRNSPEGPLSADGAIGYVGPGYEFFLAGLYLLFGHSYAVVWTAQAVLHTLSSLLVYRLTRRVLPADAPSGVALLATAMFGLHPDLIQMAAMLLTETLYIFLLIASLWTIAAFMRERHAAVGIGAGVALALAILVRPSALLLLAVFALFLLVARQRKVLALVLLLQVLLIGPWTLRNYLVYRSFVFTTAAGGVDLWIGNNPQATGGFEPTPQITAYLQEHGFIQTEAKGLSEVARFIIAQPLDYVRLQAVKTSQYFSVARTSAWWWNLAGAARVVTFVLSSAFSFVLFILGISGLVLVWRQRHGMARWLSVMALTVPASVIPIEVETRYRYPFYPFLAVFAGLALELLRTRKISWRWFVWVAGLVSANTLFDLAGNLQQALSRLVQMVR